MQDLTNPTTPTEDTHDTASRPGTTRVRTRGAALAIAFALVAVGCTNDPSTGQAAGEDVAAADTDGQTTTDDDSAATDDSGSPAEEPETDDTDNATGPLQQLEDVAGGGEFVPLGPGPYTGELLDGLVVSVPEGVGVIFDENNPPESYMFDGAGTAFVLPITGVVPPDRVGSPVATEELNDVLTAVPDDLGTYFDVIPQVEVLDSGATDTYRWWDIQVRPDLGDTHTECTAPPGEWECTSLFGEPTGAVTLDVMTDWKPRIVQPIAKPSILLWAAGQDGTIGPSHELALTLAEGLE